MTDQVNEALRALAERAIPFLRDEAENYEDDGSNEPLELAREIESLLASSPSDESALSSASLAFDGGAEAAHPSRGVVDEVAERRALNKALDALDALSERWATEIGLDAMCANLAKAEDVPAAIRAMAVQAWVEGAYAGRTSHQATQPADQHPDDAAVDRFAAAMKAKLAEARAKGRGGWHEPGLQQRLSDMLREHVNKGDPRDVANFACFLFNRGEAIAAAALPAAPVAMAIDPRLAAFYQVATVAELLAAQEEHIQKLQDSARRNVKPWEDTFPPTLLPKYLRDSGLTPTRNNMEQVRSEAFNLADAVIEWIESGNVAAARDAISDSLAAIAAQPAVPSVPEDWVLVPKHYAENVGYAAVMLEGSESAIDRLQSPALHALVKLLAATPAHDQPEGSDNE